MKKWILISIIILIIIIALIILAVFNFSLESVRMALTPSSSSSIPSPPSLPD